MDINNNAFEEDHCQYFRSKLDIKIVLSSRSLIKIVDIVASTVFYVDYEKPFPRMDLIKIDRSNY